MAYDLEEQEQLASIKAWWSKYGNLLTWVLIVALAAYGAWSGWNIYQRKQSQQASQLYEELQKAAEAKDSAKVLRAATDMQDKFGGTSYAQMSALVAAKTAFEANDVDNAKKQLQWIIDHGRDAEYKAIAAIRLAGVLLDAKAYDDAVWPGANARALMGEFCVAVCSPGAEGRANMARGDFRAAPLLQLQTRVGAWEEWFAQSEHLQPPDNLVAGHRFDLFSSLVAAVRADLGVALVPHYFVERELRSGELVLACAHRAPSRRGYSVFVAPHRAADPLMEAFVAWLCEVAAA